MNRLVLAGLLFASLGVPALAQSPTKEDDAAVRSVVARYVDAREARDAKAVEALLTPDADQLVSDGTWRRGRESLVQGMLESSRKNPAKRTIEVESVRLLAADVALADGRYTQVGADVRAMWTSIVLTRTADGWKIAGIRNMLPSPPAAK
ncbi:YybH family protein [Paludisphaera mucosa]|uniref:SgcJ/EcaC family oxidoreductase n=1 Tax=Paludisphaera mucosa TaxID=3030827 RepID=A0ABT6FKN6_9BACT|nr:SgcJ/EcaC family oxidoreductase [Paludisphaera mucosa]MDG3007933.1 SgcJ/EcaC family oxidoreductase [Paludisphaera mucosa]